MDDIMKMLVDNAIDRDIEQWLGQSEEGEKIDANEIYFALTSFVDEKRESSGEEFRVLIDSSVRTAHNRFFVDVINRESMGIIHGWTGFACVPNTGRCVVSADPLSKKMGRQFVSFAEMQQFVDEQNINLKGRSK